MRDKQHRDLSLSPFLQFLHPFPSLSPPTSPSSLPPSLPRVVEGLDKSRAPQPNMEAIYIISPSEQVRTNTTNKTSNRVVPSLTLLHSFLSSQFHVSLLQSISRVLKDFDESFRLYKAAHVFALDRKNLLVITYMPDFMCHHMQVYLFQ